MLNTVAQKVEDASAVKPLTPSEKNDPNNFRAQAVCFYKATHAGPGGEKGKLHLMPDNDNPVIAIFRVCSRADDLVVTRHHDQDGLGHLPSEESGPRFEEDVYLAAQEKGEIKKGIIARFIHMGDSVRIETALNNDILSICLRDIKKGESWKIPIGAPLGQISAWLEEYKPKKIILPSKRQLS